MDKKYLLSEEESNFLFSDVMVIDDIKKLEGLTISKVIYNNYETEVDDDSAVATQILVLHVEKNGKKKTCVFVSDIGAWGGYEVCPQSNIKVKMVNNVPTIYWDADASLPNHAWYSGFTLEGIRQAADWGVVKYGIIPIAEKYMKDLDDHRKELRITNLKQEIANNQKELDNLINNTGSTL